MKFGYFTVHSERKVNPWNMASRKFPVRDDNADTQSDYSVLWEIHGVLLCEFPPKLKVLWL